MIQCKEEYGKIQYEDEFVLLTEDFLIIKRYFFPLMKPKIIRNRDLRIAYFDSQENSKYGILRTWGKSNNDIYWAVDFRRCLPGEKFNKSNIVIDIEDGVKKGFTVKDAQSFFDSLRLYAPISLIIVDNLNI
uniref:Uncharacterized protein n=1 Tax=Panagrolaimus davidi TaxID=227884 RepID=A0A914Q3X9_9BILA